MKSAGINALRVATRDAAFQQWQSLLTNRNKRLRAGEFLVQGVRPITMAVEQGWAIRALLHDGRPSPSSWAKDLWTSLDTTRYVVAPELMRELGEKSDAVPELLAVAGMPPEDLSRIPVTADLLVTVFDRPSSPGNVGTLIRAVDAFGGTALLVTGHAADPYDPKCIRASTGSLFSVPVVRAASHREILAWVDEQNVPIVIIGTDERGTEDLRAFDFARPIVLVVGNETTGMTAGWREKCDFLVKIPMVGTVSSLNAATAGSVVLYEAMRQRGPRTNLFPERSVVLAPPPFGQHAIEGAGRRAPALMA